MITVADLLAVLRLQDEMSGQLVTATANINQAAQQIAAQLNTVTQSANQASAAMGGGGTGGGQGGGGGLAGGMGNAGRQARQTAYQITLLGRGLQEVGMIMSGVSVAIIAVGRNVLEFGGKFESTTTKLVSLAGVTRSELEGVKKHIMDLAPAVGIGPNALAEAMYTISSVVQDTSVALNILDISAKGSTAGMGEAADVAKGLTAVINSYGSANITAARAGDIMTRAIQDGGAEARQLAPILADVVPFAAKMGVSFEEVGANFATMTKLSIPAGEAVTTMASVFAALTRETIRGERALKEVGSSYKAIKEEIREKGLAATLIHLKELFEGNEKGLFAVLGRLEALKNVLGTTGAQAETYLLEVERMYDSHGKLEESFQTMSKTQEVMWNKLTAAVEAMWIEMSYSLLPVFKGLIAMMSAGMPILRGIVAIFNAINEHPLGRVFTSIAIAVTGLVAALGPFLIVSGMVVVALGNITRGLAMMNIQLTAAKVATMLWNPWVIGITIALVALSAAVIYFAGETGKATESILESTSARIDELDALKKLKSEIDNTKGSTENYYNTAQKLIKIAPDYIVSLDKEVVKYKEIEKAIREMTEAKKADLAIQLHIVNQQLNKLSEEKAEANKQLALARQFKGGEGAAAFGPEGGSSLVAGTDFKEYDRLTKSIATLDEQIKPLMQSHKELKEILDPAFRASENLRRSTEASAEAAKRRSASALSQVVAEQSLLDKVASLTSVQRAAIDEARKQGLNAKQTVAELEKEGLATQVTAEMVQVYVKQKNAATQATKAYNKEADKLDLQNEAIKRINTLIGDQFADLFMTKEAWAKLGFTAGANLSDMRAATKLSEGALREMKHAIDEAAEADRKYAKDMETSRGRVKVLTEEIEALQIKATGDTYAAKIAAVDVSTQKEINSLNKLSVSWEQYTFHLIALLARAQKEKFSIEEAQKRKHEEILDSLRAEDEKYTEDTSAIWEQYYGLLDQMKGDALGKEISDLTTNYIEAEALNQKHLDKMLAQIKENDALSIQAQEFFAETEKAIHKQRSDALRKFYDLQVELAKKAAEQQLEQAKRINKLNEQLNIMGSLFSEIEANSSGAFKTILGFGNQIFSFFGRYLSSLAAIPAGADAATKSIQTMAATSQLAMATMTMGISIIVGALFAAFSGADEKLARKNTKKFNDSLKELGVTAEQVAPLLAELARTDNNPFTNSSPGESNRNKILEDLKKIREEVSNLLSEASDSLNRFGGRAPAALQPMIDALLRSTRLSEQQRDLLEEMSGGVTWQTLEEAAGRYGIELDKLGARFQQLKSNDIFDTLFSDWTMFSDTGADANEVMDKMSAKLSEAVNRAKKFGTDIPEYMRPMLQAFVDAGKLIDENGNALTDLGGINFSASIESSMDKIAKILEKIYNLFAGISNMPLITIPVETDVRPPNTSRGSFWGGGTDDGFLMSPSFVTNGGAPGLSPNIKVEVTVNHQTTLDGEVLTSTIARKLPEHYRWLEDA